MGVGVEFVGVAVAVGEGPGVGVAGNPMAVAVEVGVGVSGSPPQAAKTTMKPTNETRLHHLLEGLVLGKQINPTPPFSQMDNCLSI